MRCLYQSPWKAKIHVDYMEAPVDRHRAQPWYSEVKVLLFSPISLRQVTGAGISGKFPVRLLA